MTIFKRRHPKDYYERDGLPEGWFAIRYDHLPQKEDRRDGHGRWFRIKSQHGTIFRVPRFANRLDKETILLDWEGWLDLNGRREDLSDSLDLEITPVQSWEALYLFHSIAKSFPNPGHRLAYNIAIFLGVISIIMGIISFL